MDYQNLLFDPVYTILGVPARLRMGTPIGDVDVTAIDKTVGVTVSQGVDVQTDMPVAAVRAAELITSGVALDYIDGKTLTMNGTDWRVSSHQLRASPNGEGDGEVWLFLDGGLG